MILREKIELAAVALAAVAAAAGARFMPGELAAGEVALTGAALLLGQGLLRDLWLKFGARIGHSCAVAHPGVAVCAESGVGISVIVAGAVLLGAGVGGTVLLSPLRWAGLVLGVGVSGFLLKDVVVDLRARRVRVERDHRSIVLW